MRISDWSSYVCSSDLKPPAPGADQIPTRTAKAHNAAPLAERNVVPRMGDRQQQPARSRRVLQDAQNRSFGPTGPTTAIASGTPPPLRSKSSANSPIRPASSSIPDDGSSNAPSHGSTAIAVWPKTSSGPSNPQPRSSMPPLPSSRSEEHTSELQSLMRTSYAVFCLKKKKKTTQPTT